MLKAASEGPATAVASLREPAPGRTLRTQSTRPKRKRPTSQMRASTSSADKAAPRQQGRRWATASEADGVGGVGAGPHPGSPTQRDGGVGCGPCGRSRGNTRAHRGWASGGACWEVPAASLARGRPTGSPPPPRRQRWSMRRARKAHVDRHFIRETRFEKLLKIALARFLERTGLANRACPPAATAWGCFLVAAHGASSVSGSKFWPDGAPRGWDVDEIWLEQTAPDTPDMRAHTRPWRGSAPGSRA